MGHQGIEVIVLGEDQAHGMFSRQVLLNLGFNKHKIRLRPVPAGKGAGDQWVREQYPGEVTVHRNRASRLNVALLVLIDADSGSVRSRKRQLDQKLQEEDKPPRSGDEPVVVWVPRRHLETWIAHLRNHPVDENRSCKRLVGDRDFRPDAARFAELYRGGDRDANDVLPSMSDAFVETDRLPSSR